LSGLVALRSQKADQTPFPAGSLALISNIPYLKDFLESSLDEV